MNAGLYLEYDVASSIGGSVGKSTGWCGEGQWRSVGNRVQYIQKGIEGAWGRVWGGV